MALGASVTGVPFAFLAGVQLLSVAAALILAGAACYPRLRRRTTPIFVIGAVLVAVADSITATVYGHASSDRLADLRAGGFLLIAIGLATGVLRPPRRSTPAALPVEAIGAGAVVVPLGASVGATTASAIAAGLAALAALRVRRDDAVGALLLCPAFALYGVSAALGHAATTSHTAALALLAARGAAALLVLGDVARLARTSVLAKVVAAMLAGVLLMAIGAVGVGSVVANTVGRQQATQARQVVESQLRSLEQERLQAGVLASVVTACARAQQPTQCDSALATFGALPGSFGAIVTSRGDVRRFGPSGNLSQAAKLQLTTQPVVKDVLAGGPASRAGESTLAVLDGELTVLGVLPISAGANATPTAAAVYGGRINNGYAAAQQAVTTYAVTVLIGGRPVASSLNADKASVVAAVARDSGVSNGALGDGAIVRSSRGNAPTVAMEQLAATDGTPLGVIAVSQDARIALAAERRVSRELFVTALAVMILVSLMAIVLGRRIVEPAPTRSARCRAPSTR
jgi:hypothetical protein